MNDEYIKSLETRIGELESIISINATKMYVPTIGACLELLRDWNFHLYQEFRNEKLIELFGKEFDYTKDAYEEVMLPKGTQLKVARIYVRHGAGDYDSITFTIAKHPTIKKFKARFWCKLNDANKIEFRLIDGKGKSGD